MGSRIVSEANLIKIAYPGLVHGQVITQQSCIEYVFTHPCHKLYGNWASWSYRHINQWWPDVIRTPMFKFNWNLMTSSNGNKFRTTGHLCGEFTGHRWIPRTKVSDAEHWCFIWSVPEYTAE